MHKQLTSHHETASTNRIENMAFMMPSVKLRSDNKKVLLCHNQIVCASQNTFISPGGG